MFILFYPCLNESLTALISGIPSCRACCFWGRLWLSGFDGLRGVQVAEAFQLWQ